MEKLSWQTIEYLHREKTNDWYWIVAIITISLAILAVILNDLIFAVLIIISSFTLSMFASKKPNTINVTLDSSSIKIGSTMYPYKNLDSFWVETREAVPKIIIKSKKVFMPFITVFIEDTEPEKVKEFLLQYLPEEENSEPLLEKILVYFGF